jgi:hypothetical protein
MHKWVSALLVGVMLAGCSGETAEEVLDGADGTPDATTAPDGLPYLPLGFLFPDFNVTDGAVIAEGTALNVTLDAPGLDNETLASLAWELSAHLLIDATGMTYNETAAAAAGGAGLPGMAAFFLPAGDYVLVAVASADGYADTNVTAAVTVVAVDLAVPAPDPCADAEVDPPLSKSVQIGPGVDGAPSGSTDVKFVVGPCQASMNVSWSYPQTCYDLDLWLTDPNGKAAGSRTSFDYPEPALAVAGKPHLPAGEWNLEVLPYLAAGCTFTLTVTFA